ncbi:hypothetical protein OBBRIDRAFT_211430 [Obba rivulosa]|uniref:Uncharacterized protein n=1 Tax=Obba rivulosa TaxID=1052685 RepID=A0A8E2ARA0_9APHY|nr:hypothetical protein OBBRIDRAFT_211430 [Obba rivulosa]
MFPVLHAILSLLFFFQCTRFTAAVLINITIDDTFGDAVTGQKFAYSPSDLWNTGQNCTVCEARLDPSKVHNGTWHDSTFFPLGVVPNSNIPMNASVSFVGTALYVFCVLAHTSSPLDGQTDMTFTVDGRVVGTFAEQPNGSPSVDYGVPVFSIDNLSPGPHQFTLTNGHVNGNTSLVLLDHVVYTTEQDEIIASSSSHATLSTLKCSLSVILAVTVPRFIANQRDLNSRHQRQ